MDAGINDCLLAEVGVIPARGRPGAEAHPSLGEEGSTFCFAGADRAKGESAPEDTVEDAFDDMRPPSDLVDPDPSLLAACGSASLSALAVSVTFHTHKRCRKSASRLAVVVVKEHCLSSRSEEMGVLILWVHGHATALRSGS